MNPEPTTSPESSQSLPSTSSHRLRTLQNTAIPPPQPPPSAPLPPIPATPSTVVSDDSSVSHAIRSRGEPLPAGQFEAQRHELPPISPPGFSPSTKTSINVKPPEIPSKRENQTIQLEPFPAPRKRAKSSSRPQTAPGPSSTPPLPNPGRVRTTSGGATPPKRSYSSTALPKSASQTHLPNRLSSPSNVRPTYLTASPISALPGRHALIPLQTIRSQRPHIPAFVTIYGLAPAVKITAPPPPQAPIDVQRRPYHLLRVLRGTLVQHRSPGSAGHKPNQNVRGGFITPKLYVPSMLWHNAEPWTLILDLPEKAKLLESLREAMRILHDTSAVHFGPVFFSTLRSPARPKRDASMDNLSHLRAPINGVDDPKEWLNALDRFSKVLADIEKNIGKKLGLGENGASVTKKMMDWSTRVAKKTIGGKGPSNELMESYVEALTGVCNLSPMLDAHFCALRTVVPGAKQPPRRPMTSRSAEQIKTPTTPHPPDFGSDPDVLPPAISHLVPRYSNLPKYVTSTALEHFEKTTKVFSSVILPLIIRDLAVLIEGLQQMRNGEWMGTLL